MVRGDVPVKLNAHVYIRWNIWIGWFHIAGMTITDPSGKFYSHVLVFNWGSFGLGFR